MACPMPPLARVLPQGPFISGITETGTRITWGLSADYLPLTEAANPGNRIALGNAHAVVLRPDGVVKCYGDNSAMQCATFWSETYGPWAAVGAGKSHSLAINTSGATYGWGAGTYEDPNIDGVFRACGLAHEETALPFLSKMMAFRKPLSA